MTATEFNKKMASLSKKYDLRLGNLSSVLEPVDAVSTGNMAIDHILGVGGFPKGRSIELFGPSSSGKTTLAGQVAANVQRLILQGAPGFENKKILYMDHEYSVDTEYFRALGLDAEDDSFLLAQPDTLEQSGNVACGLVETGQVALVIFDSVAAMVSSAAMDSEVGSSLPALQARLMSDLLKNKLNGLLSSTGCIGVFLNHIAEEINIGGYQRSGYKKMTTPGGRALKYYSSVRVEFRQIKNLKGARFNELTMAETDMIEATDVLVKVVKNKCATPFREAIVRVRFGRGFDEAFTALQILTGHKLIQAPGGGFLYFHNVPELVTDDMARSEKGDRPYIRGEAALFEKLDTDPEWREKFCLRAREALQGASG